MAHGRRGAPFRRGHRFRKRSGLRACFHREIVKPGSVEIEWGRFFDQLFDSRHEGDSLVLVAFEPEFVGEQLIRTSQFLQRLRRLDPPRDDADEATSGPP